MTTSEYRFLVLRALWAILVTLIRMSERSQVAITSEVAAIEVNLGIKTHQ